MKLNFFMPMILVHSLVFAVRNPFSAKLVASQIDVQPVLRAVSMSRYCKFAAISLLDEEAQVLKEGEVLADRWIVKEIRNSEVVILDQAVGLIKIIGLD